ncbi:hypothetical protein GCM10023191_017140 [Actinoallomurus oryzae]|uniref:histidine kinase n=1 Tax=Actinoallomurus oryzae TaxID=502180 RepID=A0ABP8PKQ2_9ACTN
MVGTGYAAGFREGVSVRVLIAVSGFREGVSVRVLIHHGGGCGFVGMRERVEALGGTLAAGSGAGVGWSVRVNGSRPSAAPSSLVRGRGSVGRRGLRCRFPRGRERARPDRRVREGVSVRVLIHYGSRYGLVGMRERVEALGGTLVAAPGAGVGWSVRVTLPVFGRA